MSLCCDPYCDKRCKREALVKTRSNTFVICRCGSPKVFPLSSFTASRAQIPSPPWFCRTPLNHDTWKLRCWRSWYIHLSIPLSHSPPSPSPDWLRHFRPLCSVGVHGYTVLPSPRTFCPKRHRRAVWMSYENGCNQNRHAIGTVLEY